MAIWCIIIFILQIDPFHRYIQMASKNKIPTIQKVFEFARSIRFPCFFYVREHFRSDPSVIFRCILEFDIFQIKNRFSFEIILYLDLFASINADTLIKCTCSKNVKKWPRIVISISINLHQQRASRISVLLYSLCTWVLEVLEIRSKAVESN